MVFKIEIKYKNYFQSFITREYSRCYLCLLILPTALAAGTDAFP